MLAMPDINVLVALAWPNHVHHEAAHRWLQDHGDEAWATCPATQTGFVRVSSNAKIIPEAKSPREAIQALERIVARRHHVFLTDALSIAHRDWVAVDKLTGHAQVTDAHLLGLALMHDGQLVTLDRGVRSLLPAGFDPERVVTLLP